MIANHKENEYLIACLAFRVLPGQAFPFPPPNLDWDHLYSIVNRHRLSGHLFVLGQSNETGWPSHFVERLQSDYYQYSLYGSQCSIHVKNILEAITSLGVRVIVLKGWAHIQTIYGQDHGQRLCDDIDILVHPAHVELVENYLTKMRFRMELESWPGYNRRYHNGTRYFVPSTETEFIRKFSVGLHWGLLHIPSYNPSRIEASTLIRNAQPFEVMGIPVFTLAPEDEVVYLSSHLWLHHRYDDSLFRYYELALSLQSTGGKALNWQKMIENAIQWQCVLPIKKVISQLNHLWPGVVDNKKLDIFHFIEVSRFERFVDLWIEKTKGHPTYDHILRWITFPRFWERPWILLQDIFPSPAYLNSRYGVAPLRFWPFHYLKRFLHAVRFFYKPRRSHAP